MWSTCLSLHQSQSTPFLCSAVDFALLIVCLLTPVIIFLVFLDTCFGVLPVFHINCMVWASGIFSAQYLSHLLLIAPCCHLGKSPPDSVVLLGL